MDMFMDKLAQKLTAQEIIKANTAADTEELNRLKSRVAEYNECLEKLQKLIDEGSAKLANAQTVNGSEINRLVEESIDKIKALQQDTAGLERLQKELTEQLNRMDATISDRLAAVDKTVAETITEKLSGQSDEKLPEKLEEVEESVHRECVKVYRNVQAVVVEENGKQKVLLEEISEGMKTSAGKVKVIMGISIGTLIISLAGTILQLLNGLNIKFF